MAVLPSLVSTSTLAIPGSSILALASTNDVCDNMTDVGISFPVKNCLYLFGSLLSLEALSSTTYDETKQQEFLRTVQEEEARFKVWVGNIGAHKTGRSSLEYRLRDASHIQKQVLELITDLTGLVEDARAILTGEKTPWDELEDDEEAFSDDDVDSGGASHTEGFPETELSQIAIDVADVINCLLRLSVAIRNPAPHDRFAASISATDTDHYEKYDIQHVEGKFRHIDQALAKRLGKAISRRRQYFKYRESHHQKLSEGVLSTGHPVVSGGGPPKDTVSTVASSIPEEIKGFSFDPARLAAVDEDAVSDAGVSQTSFASSTAEAETLKVPQLPKEADKGPFECPFCFMMITATTTISWRRHVFGDLRPYVCLSEECIDSGREFARRHEWTAHEVQNHWKKYVCPAGCNHIFSSASKCREHLASMHPGSIPASQVDAMISLGARPLGPEDGIRCPLCQEPLSSFKQYQRHVGRHQEQLALFALPHLDSMEEEGESDEQDAGESDIKGSSSDGADGSGIDSEEEIDLGKEVGEPEEIGGFPLHDEEELRKSGVEAERGEREAGSKANLQRSLEGVLAAADMEAQKEVEGGDGDGDKKKFFALVRKIQIENAKKEASAAPTDIDNGTDNDEDDSTSQSQNLDWTVQRANRSARRKAEVQWREHLFLEVQKSELTDEDTKRLIKRELEKLEILRKLQMEASVAAGSNFKEFKDNKRHEQGGGSDARMIAEQKQTEEIHQELQIPNSHPDSSATVNVDVEEGILPNEDIKPATSLLDAPAAEEAYEFQRQAGEARPRSPLDGGEPEGSAEWISPTSTLYDSSLLRFLACNSASNVFGFHVHSERISFSAFRPGKPNDSQMTVRATVTGLDGGSKYWECTGEVLSPTQAKQLGGRLGETLIQGGARKILDADILDDTDVLEPGQPQRQSGGEARSRSLPSSGETHQASSNPPETYDPTFLKEIAVGWARAVLGCWRDELGVQTAWGNNSRLGIKASVLSLTGQDRAYAELEREVVDTRQAREMGENLGQLLIERGAQKVLGANRGFPAEDKTEPGPLLICALKDCTKPAVRDGRCAAHEKCEVTSCRGVATFGKRCFQHRECRTDGCDLFCYQDASHTHVFDTCVSHLSPDCVVSRCPRRRVQDSPFCLDHYREHPQITPEEMEESREERLSDGDTPAMDHGTPSGRRTASPHADRGIKRLFSTGDMAKRRENQDMSATEMWRRGVQHAAKRLAEGFDDRDLPTSLEEVTPIASRQELPKRQYIFRWDWDQHAKDYIADTGTLLATAFPPT